MNNPDLQQVLRCSSNELTELKSAVREQMLQTYVNGRPIIDQLPSIADEDGTLRADIWRDVADQREAFSAMLSGTRWVHGKPPNHDDMLQAAKTKIFHDLNSTARKTSMKRRMESDIISSARSAVRSASNTTPGLPIVSPSSLETPLGKRMMSKRTRGRPYPSRLASALTLDGRTLDDPIILSDNTPRPTSPSASEWNSMEDVRLSPAVSRASTPLRHSALLSNQSESETTPMQEPVGDTVQERTTLSTKIEHVVSRSTAALEARITSIENGQDMPADLNARDRNLHEALLKEVRVMLAERDAAIKRLRDDLEEERMWKAI